MGVASEGCRAIGFNVWSINSSSQNKKSSDSFDARSYSKPMLNRLNLTLFLMRILGFFDSDLMKQASSSPKCSTTSMNLAGWSMLLGFPLKTHGPCWFPCVESELRSIRGRFTPCFTWRAPLDLSRCQNMSCIYTPSLCPLMWQVKSSTLSRCSSNYNT